MIAPEDHCGFLCLVLPAPRPFHVHRGPLADLAFYADVPTVRLGRPLGNRQPETAPGCKQRGGPTAVEAVKDVRQGLGGNARPAVLHGDLDDGRAQAPDLVRAVVVPLHGVGVDMGA